MKDISIESKETGRRSTLLIGGNKLFVLGNLPHGYTFEPTTIKDAEKLIDYLQAWLESKGINNVPK